MPVMVLDKLANAPGGLRRLLRGADTSVVLGLIAGAFATLLGTAVLVAAFVWPPAPSTSAAAGSPPSAAGHPGGSAQHIPSASVTASPSRSTKPTPGTSTSSGSRTAAPVPLTARFTKGADGGLAGYQATVAITNPGTAPVSGWTVTLTLPRSTLNVTDVDGATVTRDGAVWTFIPVSTTAQVAAGRQVTVSFRVSGAALLDATPTGCAIDGRPCQGVG
ncbi:cellulose-binding domain-containing protein [Dactylosporangium sp. NBC_01737]|uniref:cellulose binding domain-containing protein n=1 Tax=Dactylosporangium sp. NBC_01737 TaxID=2975959 RepID=UPI002E111086|nr:cellulose-binding domain-containing protein [Dactylosporangium sp. NBC_01737]